MLAAEGAQPQSSEPDGQDARSGDHGPQARSILGGARRRVREAREAGRKQDEKGAERGAFARGHARTMPIRTTTLGA